MILDDNLFKGYLNFLLVWLLFNIIVVLCRFVKFKIYIMKIFDLMCKICMYLYIYIYVIFYGIMGFVFYLRVIMMNLCFNEISVVLK